jgi:tetratricopeptide (TPR) repeat protein
MNTARQWIFKALIVIFGLIFLAGTGAQLFQNFQIPPEQILARAEALLEAGQPEQALQESAELRAKLPTDLRVIVLEAKIYQRQKKFDQAIARFEQAVTLQPSNVLFHQRLAVLYSTQKKYPQAETALRKALKMEPLNAPMHNMLGLLYLEQKRYPEAEQALLEAIKSQPQFPEAYRNLGAVYQAQGKAAEAGRYLAQYLKLNPQAPNAGYIREQLRKTMKSAD